MANNENRVFPNQQFYGGQSSDEAIGTPASFSYSRALDHRTNPSQLSVLPGPRKIADLNDLLLNMVQVANGTRYGIGDQGYIYKLDTTNTLTFFSKLPTGTDGMLYKSDSDAVYCATKTDVRRIYPVSGTPTVDQTYGPSRSIDTNAYATGGTNTYTVPTTLTESDAQYFQPDIEPFYSIKVKVVTKGTGSLTLTLHDGLNNILTTKTLTNTEINTGLVEFVFTSPVRALVKPNARTYHFHLTSTVADTTVACATANNLDTADYELWANRLVSTTNGFHPMAQFQQFVLIGNGRYLAVWEPLTDANPPNAEFERHRLTFPDGFEVCGIAVTDEFAVIACAKYSSDGTKDFQEGKLFTWDGTAQTYNQVVDVSGGAPEAAQSHENYPYFFVNGTLCAWPGGKNIVKVRTLANTSTTYADTIDNTKVYPNMMCIRDNLLHAGYPSVTSNTAIEHGVYIWGSIEKNYAASFNYGYVASSHQDNTTGAAIQLGCVRNFGDEMYISWKDANGNYGLDIVDSYCDPAPVFKFRARRFDAGAVYKNKRGLRMQLDTASLPSGVTIIPTYKIDDNTETSQAEFALGAGDTTKVSIIDKNFRRIKIGFDGTSTATSPAVIYGQAFQWNPLIDDKAF